MNRRQTIPAHLRYTIDQFRADYPNDDACLESIKNSRYPGGVTYCSDCEQERKLYRVAGRTAYVCERGHQFYPLAGTIFEKSTTPLHIWFYAMYQMGSTRCGISAKQIQRETGVTYKTAWRIFKQIRSLLSETDMQLEGSTIEIDASLRNEDAPMCAESQPYIPAHELFSLLFDDDSEEKYLAMLHRAYIDDSADRNRERVIISGAIVGNEYQWKPFYKPWRERLAQDGLEYFKDSHCKTLNGQFHKFRGLPNNDGRIRADKVRDDLDAIIKNTQLGTIGVVLPVPFHDAMLADPAKFGPVPKIPYHLAFQQVLAECAKLMKLVGRNSIVTFVHDDGSDFPVLHEIYKLFKEVNPKLGRVMADFVPLDDKLHPPLQAADVAASVTYRYAEDWSANPTPDNLKRLRDTMYKIVFWGAQEILQTDEESAPARVKYVIHERA